MFSEFIGSLGDLGTLLPLMLGLIVYNGINPAHALLLLGITYIGVGLYYRLPVPVQPLKATAMIAIAVGASKTQIAAAALEIAAILLLLNATRTINTLNHVFPKLLIRGLQFGLGLLMVRTGMKFILDSHANLLGTLKGVHAAQSGAFPMLSDFTSALSLLVLPQIPLTLGNAILATHDCAQKYFGNRADRVTPSHLSFTIALGNIAAGLFGGIPICHGAGGMTAHYRLGARTGAAPVMIGTLFVLASITAGASFNILSSIPASLLGVSLLYVGIRHALLAGHELRALRTAAVVSIMGILTYLFSNMLLSLGVGLAVKFIILDLPAIRKRARAKEANANWT